MLYWEEFSVVSTGLVGPGLGAVSAAQARRGIG